MVCTPLLSWLQAQEERGDLLVPPGATAKAMTKPVPGQGEWRRAPHCLEGIPTHAGLAPTSSFMGPDTWLLSCTCVPVGRHVLNVYTLLTTPHCRDFKINQTCTWVHLALRRK